METDDFIYFLEESFKREFEKTEEECSKKGIEITEIHRIMTKNFFNLGVRLTHKICSDDAERQIEKVNNLAKGAMDSMINSVSKGMDSMIDSVKRKI